MALEDSIVELLEGVVEDIVIDGITGFVPIGTIGRLLLGRGLQDKGNGQPTRRQLMSIKSTMSRRSDLFEMRRRGRTTYVTVRRSGKTMTLGI